jgi:3'(2'), 5'-bisphosphate nucleotidase
MAPPVVDGAFARWLVARAAQTLLDAQAEFGFDDPATLLPAAGKLARDVLLTELARWRPADAVLAEEAGRRWPARAVHRIDADRVWIVDPLGGPREFTSPGRTDWTVQVALWRRRTGLVAGAVGLPGLHRVLGTDHPPAYPPLSVSAATGGPLRIATGRGSRPAVLARLVAALGAVEVPLGCPGARIAAVICGEADAYVQPVGGYEWNTAGAVAVASATGLYASRTDGSTLRYNQTDPRLPDLLVCRRDLAPGLLAATRAAGLA